MKEKKAEKKLLVSMSSIKEYQPCNQCKGKGVPAHRPERCRDQPCNWCKGKGVPAHCPENCRDQRNPESRLYEAPSKEQEEMDRRTTSTFSFGGFANATPQMPFFNFNAPVSAFVPGGGACLPPPKPFNFFEGYVQLADGTWVADPRRK